MNRYIIRNTATTYYHNEVSGGGTEILPQSELSRTRSGVSHRLAAASCDFPDFDRFLFSSFLFWAVVSTSDVAGGYDSRGIWEFFFAFTFISHVIFIFAVLISLGKKKTVFRCLISFNFHFRCLFRNFGSGHVVCSSL